MQEELRSRHSFAPRGAPSMYVEKKRRCDTGCRRRATVLRQALDLGFCDKHVDLYLAAGLAEEARMRMLWGEAYRVYDGPIDAYEPKSFA